VVDYGWEFVDTTKRKLMNVVASSSSLYILYTSYEVVDRDS
jgi:hypothetical protein